MFLCVSAHVISSAIGTHTNLVQGVCSVSKTEGVIFEILLEYIFIENAEGCLLFQSNIELDLSALCKVKMNHLTVRLPNLTHLHPFLMRA